MWCSRRVLTIKRLACLVRGNRIESNRVLPSFMSFRSAHFLSFLFVSFLFSLNSSFHFCLFCLSTMVFAFVLFHRLACFPLRFSFSPCFPAIFLVSRFLCPCFAMLLAVLVIDSLRFLLALASFRCLAAIARVLFRFVAFLFCLLSFLFLASSLEQIIISRNTADWRLHSAGS